VRNDCFEFDEVTTAAANRLGFDPSDAKLLDGEAQIPIILTDTVSLRDLNSVMSILRQQGAKSVKLDTGPIINPSITNRLNNAVAENRKFIGFNVIKTNDPNNMFILKREL